MSLTIAPGISRSQAAAALACLALLGWVSGAFADDAPVAGAPVKPIRALLVCGGCCHDYDTQKQLISRGLEQRAHFQFTVVQQGGKTTDTKIPLYEDQDWAKPYDVVLHDECFAGVKDRDWTARILEPHRRGLPAVVIHCAMHCYRDGADDWFQFCGVTSRRHGKAYPHEVVAVDAESPILRGWGTSWANPAGELYWIEKVWPTARPLCTSKNQENGNDETCVWTNQFDRGRVFGTTLGHHNETVSHPKYLDLLTRGTLWACDKLDDRYLKPVSAESTSLPAEAPAGSPTPAPKQ